MDTYNTAMDNTAKVGAYTGLINTRDRLAETITHMESTFATALTYAVPQESPLSVNPSGPSSDIESQVVQLNEQIDRLYAICGRCVL